MFLLLLQYLLLTTSVSTPLALSATPLHTLPPSLFSPIFSVLSLTSPGFGLSSSHSSERWLLIWPQRMAPLPSPSQRKTPWNHLVKLCVCVHACAHVCFLFWGENCGRAYGLSTPKQSPIPCALCHRLKSQIFNFPTTLIVTFLV